MELIQTIRAEIERLYDEANNYDDSRHYLGEVLSFLSTLESKKPMEQDGLEEELEKEINKAMKSDLCPEEISNYDFRCIARHFFNLGLNARKV